MKYGFGGRFCPSHGDPKRIYASRISEPQIRLARKFLVRGFTLKEAARAVNVMATDLDKTLWAFLGIEIDDPGPKYHLMFRE